MRTGRRIAETIHVVALGLWLGALVMTGATAATTFPLMRDLDPTLGAYPGYGGPHWSLAAGHVVAQVFAISDIVQLGGFVLAGASLAIAAAAGLPSRRWLSTVRAATVVLLGCLLAYQFLVLAPRMQEHLGDYWQAAAAGQDAEAEEARLAFAADHPRASRLMGMNAALVFVALVCGAWSITSPAGRRPTEEPDARFPQARPPEKD